MKTTVLNKVTSFKGFTLIELLVVIGILGVLAAALIATLDPLEQTRRGQDTAKKSAAVEFADAVNRYYTNHNYMPWSAAPGPDCLTGSVPTATTGGGVGAAALGGTTLATLIGAGGAGPCYTALTGDAELKSTFAQLPSTTQSALYVNDNNGVVTVCFQPQSKAQQKDANTIYDDAGNVQASGTCLAQSGGTNKCMWCAR